MEADWPLCLAHCAWHSENYTRVVATRSPGFTSQSFPHNRNGSVAAEDPVHAETPPHYLKPWSGATAEAPVIVASGGDLAATPKFGNRNSVTEIPFDRCEPIWYACFRWTSCARAFSFAVPLFASR